MAATTEADESTDVLYDQRWGTDLVGNMNSPELQAEGPQEFSLVTPRRLIATLPAYMCVSYREWFIDELPAVLKNGIANGDRPWTEITQCHGIGELKLNRSSKLNEPSTVE
ncbi:hypothetical protein FOZ60_014268 [Perkinsus olseni]|uniref:Uncharacterized protein n=1 Tax=Perkinsus olseni TaxID=32597 RepID=A0A7J6N865_PEROL|nr:hypothetical protein FOZ60_014268 [Perkinsus olseni]